MKASELCKMIEGSIRSGRYPFASETEKKLAPLVSIESESESDDLSGRDTRIKVRIQDLYMISNYVPNIQHLPGVIEMDILDSFRIICRKMDRIDAKGLTSTIKKM